MKPYGRSDKGWCCEYEDGPVDSPSRKRTAGKAAKHRTRSTGKKEIKNQLAQVEPEDLIDLEPFSIEENGIVYTVIGGTT